MISTTVTIPTASSGHRGPPDRWYSTAKINSPIVTVASR